MTQPLKPKVPLPFRWIALDMFGSAMLFGGFFIQYVLPAENALKNYALPLMVVGGMLTAFATVLILRHLYEQQIK
jgi:hypothetical protein